MRSIQALTVLAIAIPSVAHAEPISADKVAEEYGVKAYERRDFAESFIGTYACIYYGDKGSPSYQPYGPLYGVVGRMPMDASGPPVGLWSEWVRKTYSLRDVGTNTPCKVWRGDFDSAPKAAEAWIRGYSNFNVIMVTGFELDWSKARPAFQDWLNRKNGLVARSKVEVPNGNATANAPNNLAKVATDRKTDSRAQERAQKQGEAEKLARNTAAEERARKEAEERQRLEAERKSKAKVDALYAEQLKQAQDHIRGEKEKIALIERQQREAEMRAAAFERALAEQRRIDAEYKASMARHEKCVGGDQQACEDIRQGVPLKVLETDERASTDDDPRRCVAAPVVSPSNSFKGQTQAVVVNGCEKPVDVRICLLRAGGWNCGVNWGIRPQDKWTHTSFNALGDVYWDARYTGTTVALGSPN